MYEQQIKDSISEAIQELNQQRSGLPPVSAVPETLLYGIDANLDSLDLVTLIVSTEQKIEDKTGIKISLANEKALSMRHSPFRSIASLTHYATTLLEERD